MRRISLSGWILIALVVGVLVGGIAPAWGIRLQPLAVIFLRLIKAIVGPLIFATLVVGIAGQGDLHRLGRVGWKALVCFEVATTCALFIGLAAVNWVQPGRGAVLAPNAATTASSVAVPAPPGVLDSLIAHAVPQSFAQALADGEVLQIAVFSLLFGFAMVAAGVGPGEPAQPLLRFSEALARTMFRLTDFVMWTAPFGVLGAVAASIGHEGLGVLWPLLQLVATLYGALVVLVVLVFGGAIALYRVPARRFLAACREPVLIAFSTASSEAALPSAIERMEAIGIDRGIVGFVIPAGYTFNLTGTALYLSIAALFIAQAASMHLSFSSQMVMMLTLMLTSKGVAGVSRAAIVVLAATAAQFHLPAAGVALLLGVDQFMDMGRTAVNVLGNCLAAAVVARWEGEPLRRATAL